MNEHDLEKALEPAPRKKSPVKYIILAILAALVIAGAYWLTQQFMVKGEVEIPLPKEMAEAVTDSLRLEDGKLGPVRITPGADTANAGGQTDNLPNTQAGRAGTDPATERPQAEGILVEPGHSATDLVPATDPSSTSGEVRQKIYSGADAVVTLDFVNDLSRYLASRYWPQGTHISAKGGATSGANIGAAGQRYGLELIGFASSRSSEHRDYLRDRSLVLNYVYNPAMISALSQLYADRFADSLAQAGFEEQRKQAGVKQPMTEKEVAGMLRYYANYSRGIGAALSAYAAEDQAVQLVRRYTQAQQKTFVANMDFDDARFRVDNAREEKKERALHEAQQDLKRAEQEYRKAMLEQERAKEAVLAFMGKGYAHRLDDQDLLYVAAWASRRGSNAGEAHQAAAAASEFIGQVLDEKAAEIES